MLRRLLVMMLSLTMSLSAAEIHVAPTGHDRHPGTRTRPVASLGAAQALARQAVAADATRPVTVVVHDGVYRLGEPLVFEAADSSPAGVRWRAAGEGPVVWSGGVPVGPWRAGDDGRWRAAWPADVVPPQQLIVGGQWADWAINRDQWHAVREVKQQDGAWKVRLDEARAPTGGGYWLSILKSWSGAMFAVASADPQTGWLTLAPRTWLSPINPRQPWHPNKVPAPGNWPHLRAWLVGHPSFVDRAGEWAFDAARREIVYRPRPGEQPATTPGIGAHLERLVEIRGTADQPVTGLSFHGIEFAHAGWRAPAVGFDDRQAAVLEAPPGMPADELSDAAIFAQHWHNGELRGCRVRLCGGHGVSLAQGCRQVRVTNCELSDIGGNGIAIGRLRDADDAVAGCEITDSVVRRAGRVRAGAVGIWIGFARDCVVSGNEVSDLPYTGISIGWRWDPSPANCGGHRVSSNHIHRVMQRLCDGAGIYALGWQAGSVMAGNRVHNVRRAPEAHRSPIAGIYFDQGSQGWTVEGNEVWDIDDRAFNFHKAGQFPDNRPTDRPDPLIIRGNRIEAAADGTLGQRNPPYDRMQLYGSADQTDALIQWQDNEAVPRGHWRPR
jgi:hypothetical protein